MNEPKEPNKAAVEKDGGLYKNLNISVRGLSMVIIAGLILLVILMFMGTRQGGYTVSFDSKGGSDVASEKYQFQDPLVLPQAPQRDGYTFDGWYLDENCTIPAEPDMPVENSIELFAKWTPAQN